MIALRIEQIRENKKAYLELLLLGDEQEDMVDRYLDRGDMFVLDDGGAKAECVVTREADGAYEIKNIAVAPECQRRGYGRALIEFVLSHYTDCETLYVGTGDCGDALRFYEKCGFAVSHRVPNFFIDHYDHPMYENGERLRDMVYLKRAR